MVFEVFWLFWDMRGAAMPEPLRWVATVAAGRHRAALLFLPTGCHIAEFSIDLGTVVRSSPVSSMQRS